MNTSAVSHATQKLQEVIIVYYGPSPPPPPLSTVVDTWAPLYFFLALCGAYAIMMLLTIGSFYVKVGGSSAESQPLQKSVNTALQRSAPTLGEYAWAGASPEMVQQYAMIDGWVRAAFIRKVYAILSTQLLVTVGIVVGLIYAAFVNGDPNYPSHFGYWVVGPGYYLTLVSMIVSMCLLCAVVSCKNQWPMNFVGLLFFTGAISFAIGVICVAYYGAGFGQQLMLAFVITCATFIALTVFTIFSKIDFSFLAPLLCCGIFVLILWSLILSIAFTLGGYSFTASYLFVIFGIILFVGFIIYDTYMIVTRLGVDDYMIAAIDLYLDVINMFLYILQLLVLCGGNRN